MTVGIVGLGLIGGSFAKAFKYETPHTVLGYDQDTSTQKFATLVGAIDGELSAENIGLCDYLILALYPAAIVKYLDENASLLKKDCIVIDCGGTKRNVCQTGFALADRYGFTFIGGHPMAGLQYSGFKYTKESMFKNAYMILVPRSGEPLETLEQVKHLLQQVGFAHITITNAEEHDRIIAFTSQLAHIVSNAYMKSPQAVAHKGFSAGSYKDLTRVAKLNDDMWSQLFLENKDNISNELEYIISALCAYKQAIDENDVSTLRLLLQEGSQKKEAIDLQCKS